MYVSCHWCKDFYSKVCEFSSARDSIPEVRLVCEVSLMKRHLLGSIRVVIGARGFYSRSMEVVIGVRAFTPEVKEL